MNLNQVTLMGRIVSDAEVRNAGSTKVADTSLAISRAYKKGDEFEEETTFVDVTFWGREAEKAGEKFKKGMTVLVVGRLTQDSWSNKDDGSKRTKLRLRQKEVKLLLAALLRVVGHPRQNLSLMIAIILIAKTKIYHFN